MGAGGEGRGAPKVGVWGGRGGGSSGRRRPMAAVLGVTEGEAGLPEGGVGAAVGGGGWGAGGTQGWRPGLGWVAPRGAQRDNKGRWPCGGLRGELGPEGQHGAEALGGHRGPQGG